MIPFPDKKYSVIYADPPWSYSGGGAARNVTKHYHTMKPEDIYSLPVQNIAADDCLLFLWATFPNLDIALETIRRWGFRYKTAAFVWVKRNRKTPSWFWGLGNWTRSNPEVCLLATRGKPKRADAHVHSVIDAPIGRHSEKPAETRDRIVQLAGGGAMIELFARKTAPGTPGATKWKEKMTMSEGIFGKNADLAQRLKDRIAFHANEHRHTYEIGKGVMDALVLDLLADFRDAGGVILPVKPNGTVWLIRRRRVVSATVMFVGAGADGLTSFSVLRGRLGTTAWSSEQFTEHDIGKTVFLTKEAAEAALEGGGAWQQ